MRLHRGGKVDRGRIALVEYRGCVGERGVEIALRDRGEKADRGIGIDRLVARRVAALAGIDRHPDEPRRRLCGFLILGDDDSDGLADMEDAGGGDARHGTAVRFADGHAGIVVDDGQHAGQRHRRLGIYPGDFAGTDRCADDRGIGDTVRRPFIGIGRIARHLGGSIDPRDRFA